MKKKGFNIVKFITYLTVGLCILGSWGYINYVNYTTHETYVQEQIYSDENVNMIQETVEDIEMEQTSLRIEQRVVNEPSALVEATTNNSEFDELERRIEELEREKLELVEEKNSLKNQISEAFSIFKLDLENPLVNAVGIPVLLYFMKKMFDLIFARIEERLHHRFEEHTHEAE